MFLPWHMLSAHTDLSQLPLAVLTSFAWVESYRTRRGDSNTFSARNAPPDPDHCVSAGSRPV